jgi:transglutaminase-like putative cysteine protease
MGVGGLSPTAQSRSQDEHGHRAIRAGGWLSLLLLTLMLLSVAWSVNGARWADGLGLLQWMVLGGALLGFALSHSRWQGLLPVLHAAVSGLTWITIWVSRLLPAEFGPRERVYQLYAGVALWVERVIVGATGTGSLIFVLLLAIVCWWLSYAAAWAVFRQQRVWRAIVPAAMVMLLNLYYAPTRLTVYFLMFTFCALMLAVRNNLAQREVDWRAARVRYAMDIGLDFLRDGVIFAALVLALAFFIPNATGQGQLEALVRPLERPWERVKAEWNRLFHSLQYPSQPSYAAFGKSLALTGPVNLGDSVIMDVRASAGRYWRAVVYHTYTGRGWLNADQESLPLGSGDRPRVPRYELTRSITQTVTTYYPGTGVLFTAGQPLRAALPAVAEVSYLPDDILPTPTPMPGGARRVNIPRPLDISMLFSRSRLKEGDSYTVVSAISKADLQSLREASDAYPDWVRDRYLQLPDEFPQRIRDLAMQITTPYDNAYDKVRALERYLREEIPYNELIAPPPADQDGVDYFLFGVREGYCDYYASAMTTMARAVGIPSRLAAGYTRGEYDGELGVYRVRELNAHAWVEVFFPSYGWVEFEPTASEPLIVRPVTPSEDRNNDGGAMNRNTEDEEDKFGEEPDIGAGPAGGMLTTEGWWPLSTLWTVVLVFGLVLAATGGFVLWLLRRPPATVPHLLTQLYGRLVQWGERLKLSWLPHQTPYEQAQLMAQAVPEGQEQIESITGLYVRECFGPTPARDEELSSAAQHWMVLQPLLWRRWLRVLVQPPERFVLWRERWSHRLARQFPG